jgi:hypothetical protein
MRHPVPAVRFVLIFLVTSSVSTWASAQDTPPPSDEEEVAPVPEAGAEVEEPAPADAPATSDRPLAAPPPTPPRPPARPSAPSVQATDWEGAGPSRAEDAMASAEPVEEAVGDGVRLLLTVQSNTTVGELIDDGSGGGFAFDRASLVGVPDALVGVRIDRFTAGLGMTWLRVNTPIACGSGGASAENSRTLFGLIPTARYDVLTTDDGRGRFEAGVAIPLLVSSNTREIVGPDCSVTDTQERSDGVYGLDLLFGGRYHVWPALSVGAEIGLSAIVFDYDADPAGGDQPSATTLTLYSGLTLAVKVPL